MPGDDLRLSFLFPHLLLGGGETAMMPVAAGLSKHFRLRIAVRDTKPLTVEPSIREELLARFPEVTLLRDGDEMAAELARADVLLWYGSNALTPETLSRMPRRPVTVRVVHTEKQAEGVEYLRRWRSVVDGVVCVSPRVARRIPGAVQIPNTYDEARLQGAARQLFPERRPTLGYLGRFFRFKNVDWLTENAGNLGINLLIQGMDTEELTRAELQGLAAARGVADRVRFLPPGPTVGTLLRSVDALALLSTMEGFPMVVIEAGALGVPVVATRVGALPSAFPDEVLFADLDGERPALGSVREALAKLEPSWGEKLGARVRDTCAPEAVVEAYAGTVRRVYARCRAS